MNEAGEFRPAPHAAAERGTHHVVAAAMGGIPLLTLIHLLSGARWPVWGLGAASTLFLVLQFKLAPTGIRRTSLVLGLVTAALLPVVDSPLPALERGILIGGLIASLLVTVNLLSRAALRVSQVRSIVASLFQLPHNQRYIGLAVASQFFGGLLGLAGVAMMMEVAARESSSSDAEKVCSFCAISRGYAALSLWSPMYSNMSIVLALYGGVQWVTVLPYAMTISVLLIALGAVLERIAGKGPLEEGQPLAHPQPRLLSRSALAVLAAMLGFVSFMVLMSHRSGAPIAAVIIASTPVAAWLLNVSLIAGGSDRIPRATRLLGQDFISFHAMAGEVMLFLASGCAGTIMASAIPPAWTAAIGQSLGGSPFVGSLFVSSTIVVLSATSIHPMLGAVLVASSFPPQVLGLPPIAHLCSVLVGWGLAIIVTPFSVLSLMASRLSGIPILVISLRANLLFVTLSLAASCAILGSTALLLRP